MSPATTLEGRNSPLQVMLPIVLVSGRSAVWIIAAASRSRRSMPWLRIVCLIEALPLVQKRRDQDDDAEGQH